ncbi:MATE family efflux transporter [Corynebacterium heidelbergense]|uniref:MATE family efflux transporter n=1 Tax=Corynebacterium heidelbergense TaxID=2055947 RepID=A0A364V908_9CORY|nr:MATE family efflux transporter [Corynebacterium heidelbergense]
MRKSGRRLRTPARPARRIPTAVPSPENSPGQERISSLTILSLAWPALLVLAATPLYLLWDTAVVGRLGATQLAALAAGATVLSTVTTQLTFLSYGTTARSARLYGAGRLADAIYEGIQATWVAIAVGSTLAVTIFAACPIIMRALAPDPEVAQLATSWMQITCLSIVPALVVMAGNGWLRGVANTRLPLLFTLAGVIPMAITVPWAVHRFGVVGSALANVLGESIVAACFVATAMLWWRRFGDARPWRPDWSVIRPQLAMGKDLIVRSLSFQVAFLSAAAVAGRMGSGALGAHQVLLQLWNFLTLVLDSVAIAAQALVGAALGRKSRASAEAVAYRVIRFSVLAGLFIAAALAAGSGYIPQLFTTDEVVLGRIGQAWWLLVVMVLIGSVVFALDGVLLGASDVRFLRTATVLSVVVGFIPLGWLSLALGWGLPGLWCGLLLFLVLRCGAVVWRFQSGRWAES